MELPLRLLLAALMVFAGLLHFARPKPYLQMMPTWVPWPEAVVYASGLLEVLFGAGLLVPPVQRYAAFGLAALFVAIFPANVNMAVNKIPLGRKVLPTWALWGRLPLQGLLVWWALWLAH
jgi:uncharacterized membrane protein